ncbi:MAG: hypothetical protein ACFE0I_14695 [Elainellaceae cyanobacterium]
MSDFQANLVETTSRLSLIISRAEEVNLNVQKLQSEAVSMRQHVDDAWNELAEHQESFQTGVESAQAELASESDAAIAALLQLQEKIGLVQEELASEFEETQELAIALGSKITELGEELGTEYTNAENAIRLLASQQTGMDLDATVSGITDSLSEIDSSIEGYQQSVEAQADAVHELISSQCLPALDARSTECTDHVEGMLTFFENQLDAMKTAVREQIERNFQFIEEGRSVFQGGDSLELKGLNDLSDELTSLTSVIEGFVGRLAEALQEGASHVVTGIGKQAEFIDETTQNFEDVSGKLQEVKDELDRLTNGG